MDTLVVPELTVNNGSVVNGVSDNDITIVVDDVDDVTDNDDVIGDSVTIETLTKEDLGLDEEDGDDVYDGLIRDFRTKMDSLSFKRLNRSELRAKAASFRAMKEQGTSKNKTTRFERSKTSRHVMLPAVKFQDLDDEEAYRRDTGGSSHDRSRASSGASTASKSARRYKQQRSQMNRKKSVMGAIMKRGRTMRKTLRAMHINEADHHDSDGYGSAPPTNEQRLRMFVLKEILDTETEYLKLLEFMVEVMTPSIQKMGEDQTRAHSCKKETTSQILSNVSEIHLLHFDFHKALEEALSPIPYHTHRIGKVFLEFKDKFSVYDEYCSNFTRAQKVCYELEKDPDFQELITEWKTSVESQSRKFLHLEGFIISPVQRICKYPLFLKELKKYTPSQHKDFKDVTQAQKVMQEVTQSVNESERRQIMVQAIKDMENMCDSWEQSGFVSKQGFMTKRGGSVKSWYIRWFLLRGYKLAYYNEPTDLHPIGVLDLTSYKSLEPDASHVGRPYAFGIKMPERTYYMYTTSEEERQEWINILQWKFEGIERSRRQAHRPFETVVFSSLSSFLHPKSQRVDSSDDQLDEPEDPNCEVINVGPTILSPKKSDEDQVFDDSDSSTTDSQSKKAPRHKSLSTSLNTSPIDKKITKKARRKTVTNTIEKSPSRARRISNFFPSTKKSNKKRVGSS
uniref:rho guanine nucleotide exchange factor 4-like n=1 Tax=Styela clava TaxID=7725 RepID=UPI00193A1110|nr:rho guanine nucleotide exchange factor 4-like [Styela clava]